MQRAHELLPASIAKDIPPLYSTEHEADPTVHVKWFTPDSSWTWYIIEYDPASGLCFGLVEGLETELGYISLLEVAQARGPLGLKVERDLHFTPCPLSQLRK